MQFADRLAELMHPSRPLSNSEIYGLVRRSARRTGRKLSLNWRATVRNTLQRRAKGHPKCKGKKPLFNHKAKGMWEVRRSRSERKWFN